MAGDPISDDLMAGGLRSQDGERSRLVEAVTLAVGRVGPSALRALQWVDGVLR